MADIEVRFKRDGSRGVFALRDFVGEEMITRDPVIFFTIDTWDTIKTRGEWQYSFAWDATKDVLILGLTALCAANSVDPNAAMRRNIDAMAVELFARPAGIKSGDEITVNWIQVMR